MEIRLLSQDAALGKRPQNKKIHKLSNQVIRTLEKVGKVKNTKSSVQFLIKEKRKWRCNGLLRNNSTKHRGCGSSQLATGRA